MNSEISPISVALPENCITDEDLEKRYNRLSTQETTRKTGTQRINIVSGNETAIDLTEKACRNLIQNIGSQQNEFLLLCTQYADCYLLTTVCIQLVQLNLIKNLPGRESC